MGGRKNMNIYVMGKPFGKCPLRSLRRRWDDISCEEGRCMEQSQDHVSGGLWYYWCWTSEFCYHSINYLVGMNYVRFFRTWNTSHQVWASLDLVYLIFSPVLIMMNFFCILQVQSMVCSLHQTQFRQGTNEIWYANSSGTATLHGNAGNNTHPQDGLPCPVTLLSVCGKVPLLTTSTSGWSPKRDSI
jgi:hypothetical protein